METKPANPQEEAMINFIKKGEFKNHAIVPVGVLQSVLKYLSEQPIKDAGETYYTLNSNLMNMSRCMELLHPKGPVKLTPRVNDEPEKEEPKKKVAKKKTKAKSKLKKK